MPGTATNRVSLKQKVLIALLLVSLWSGSGVGQSHELWNLKLTGEGDLQSFERSGAGFWTTQQGLVFLTSERVLVYQVNETAKPAPLGKRRPSGGGGNFLLTARILDASTGHQIKRMQFVTSADYSTILPAHDGKFIVRAGDVLALFSPDFGLLRSKTLRLDRTAPVEYWEVRVTPSGTQVVLAHQHVFAHPEALLDGTQLTSGKAEADIEVLNADTLEVIRELHLPYYLPVWSPHERFLLTTAPKKPLNHSEFGTMDFQGHWTALLAASQQPWDQCPYNIDLLDHDLMAAHGCTGLVVFPESGEKALRVRARSGEWFGSANGADYYLATGTAKYALSTDGRPLIKPLSIEVYDLRSRERIMTVKLERRAVYYALSAQGLLAVIDGDTLKVYERER
jgi:hypothetical protein